MIGSDLNGALSTRSAVDLPRPSQFWTGVMLALKLGADVSIQDNFQAK